MLLTLGMATQHKSATRSRLTFGWLIVGEVSSSCQYDLSDRPESSNAMLMIIVMRRMFSSRIENEMKSSKMLSFLVCPPPTLCSQLKVC